MIHKDSLKFIEMVGQGQMRLSVSFDAEQPGTISVIQGCFEKVQEINGKPVVQYIPKKDSPFEKMPQQVYRFDAGKQQKLPEDFGVININNYFSHSSGADYTKAALTYYPLILHLKTEPTLASGSYEAIYYLQFLFSRNQTPTPQLLKQKILHNGQLFELTEAYGLGQGRTDEAGSQECVICLTNPKSTIAKPCKHVSLCAECA